jgi:hypothetical protein
MTSKEEVQATLRASEELLAKSGKLLAEAADPARSIAKLMSECDKQFDRMRKVLRSKAPQGTGYDCVHATIEMLVDWGPIEVLAIQTMGEDHPGKSGGAPGVRRGMRV